MLGLYKFLPIRPHQILKWAIILNFADILRSCFWLSIIASCFSCRTIAPYKKNDICPLQRTHFIFVDPDFEAESFESVANLEYRRLRTVLVANEDNPSILLICGRRSVKLGASEKCDVFWTITI